MKRPFPMISLLVENKPCLIIGGQEEALKRAEELSDAGAMIQIVARRASDTLLHFATAKKIAISVREVASQDLEGAFFVVNTSRDTALAAQVYEWAKPRRCILATLDDPARSDIGFVAVARSGLLRVGVSTGGASPALARRLREELERIFVSERTERLLRWMEKKREEWHAKEKSFAVRSQELRNLLEGLSIDGVLRYPKQFLSDEEKNREDL
jgi:precorrin-2 dehydrogenase/sirohydrochlorin ferrochelatase